MLRVQVFVFKSSYVQVLPLSNSCSSGIISPFSHGPYPTSQAIPLRAAPPLPLPPVNPHGSLLRHPHLGLLPRGRERHTSSSPARDAPFCVRYPGLPLSRPPYTQGLEHGPSRPVYPNTEVRPSPLPPTLVMTHHIPLLRPRVRTHILFFIPDPR